jgi:hypothetical protein
MKKTTTLITLLLILTFHGFGQKDEYQQKELRKNFSLENIEELETEIDFPVGGLIINSTSDDAVKTIFKYNAERWKPEIEFEQDGITAYLELDSEKQGRIGEYNKEDQNVWGILLSKNVRHELDIEIGAGKSKINLEGCKVKRFEMSMGAGEANINLSNTSMEEFELEAGVGEANIDLTGNWDNDMDANITGGIGEVDLLLPASTGIKIDVRGILGEVDIQGFKKDGNTYTNDLYGKTENTLYIDLTGGLGEITVKTVED